MAQYKIPDPEELMQCPYNKAHLIKAKRVQYHLMKCRKNYAGNDFATCPFNARHEMPRPELRYHMVHCPDKAMIEPTLSHESSKRNGRGTLFKGHTDVPDYEAFTVPQRENWEEEIPSVARVGVDPKFFSALPFKDTTGMTKQQKMFYKQQLALPPEERQYPVDYQEPLKEREEKRLRLPHEVPHSYIGMHLPQQRLQQPSQVFVYSMSMAGVGRGQSFDNFGNHSQPQINGIAMPASTQAPQSSLMFPGRGGSGRRMSPPTLMMAGGNFNPSTNGQMRNEESTYLTNGYMLPQQPVQELNNIMTQPQQAAINPMAGFVMGAGRGRRSRIAPGLDINKAQPVFFNSKSENQENSKSWPDELQINNNEDSGNNVSDQELQEDMGKIIKKIMKKLKQIEILEEKKNKGENLGTEEEVKISQKADLNEKLAALQM